MTPMLAGAAMVAGGLGLVLGPTGAGADATGGRLALSGVGVCDPATGSEVVTWTATNVDFPSTTTVVVHSYSPGTITPLSLVLAPKASGTFTQTMAGTSTGATLTVHNYVPGIDNEIKPPLTVTLPGDCHLVVPPTTTPTVPTPPAGTGPPTITPPSAPSPTVGSPVISPPAPSAPVISAPAPDAAGSSAALTSQPVIQTGGPPPSGVGALLGAMALSLGALVAGVLLWRRRQHGAS
ncbi:MAG TPA: hypothetical protein VKG43_00425 [Acidimicrobiales bacterium]|nr:hypothetical protein [Acidimicrobiales bacterium]